MNALFLRQLFRFVQIQLRTYLLPALLLSLVGSANAQHVFTGSVNLDSTWHQQVYLSIIRDHQSLYSISRDDLLFESPIDSTGGFSFSGDQLPEQDQIYRLHVIPKDGDISTYIYSAADIGHNFCLFIANGSTGVTWEPSNGSCVFGEISSNQIATDDWQELDSLRIAVGSQHTQSSDAGTALYTTNLLEALQAFAHRKKHPLTQLMAAYHALEIINREEESLKKQFPVYADWFNSVIDTLNTAYPGSAYAIELQKEVEYLSLKLEAPQLRQQQKWMGLLYGGMVGFFFISLFFFAKWRKLKRSIEKSLQADQSNYDSLTKQERRIVEHIKAGASNKEIAETLFISVSTVKSHLTSIYSKLEITSREELQGEDQFRV